MVGGRESRAAAAARQRIAQTLADLTAAAAANLQCYPYARGLADLQ